MSFNPLMLNAVMQYRSILMYLIHCRNDDIDSKFTNNPLNIMNTINTKVTRRFATDDTLTMALIKNPTAVAAIDAKSKEQKNAIKSLKSAVRPNIKYTTGVLIATGKNLIKKTSQSTEDKKKDDVL